MSYNLNPLNVVKVLDPIVDLNAEREYAILNGGSEVSWKNYASNSSSNTSTNFSCPPPNPGIIVDRKVYIKMPIGIDFYGTAAVGSNLLQTGFDAFRALPVSSVLNSLQVTLNNTSCSINMADVIQPLMRYHNNTELKEHEYSTSPMTMDQTQNYSDLNGANFAIRNPLSGYGDSNDGSQMGRGAFPLVNISVFQNTPNYAHIEAEITEELFLSPFYFGHGNHCGFIGLQTMDFTFNWVSDLSRIWSHSAGAGTFSQPPVVTFGLLPTLLFKYITPKELMHIPRHIEYPYFTVDRYPTNFSNSFVPNSIITIPSQNIQLNSIPRRIYICARKTNSKLTYTDTDTFFAIDRISINWQNRVGLLSSCSSQDLYNISKKNGCNLSWTEWSGGPTLNMSGTNNTLFGTVGSVLAIELGTDVGLQDLESPGINSSIQVQLDVTLRNVNQTITLDGGTLYIIVVSEGTFTIEDNRSVTQIGVISRQDILNAKSSPNVNYHDVEKVMGSGSFFGDLKRFGKSAFEQIKKYGPSVLKTVREDVIPIAKELAPLLAAGDGVIVGGEGDGGAFVGGRQMVCPYCRNARGGCDMCAGVLLGGRVMPKRSLKKRMRKY
jgi:hypothetical protein